MAKKTAGAKKKGGKKGGGKPKKNVAVIF